MDHAIRQAGGWRTQRASVSKFQHRIGIVRERCRLRVRRHYALHTVGDRYGFTRIHMARRPLAGFGTGRGAPETPPRPASPLDAAVDPGGRWPRIGIIPGLKGPGKAGKEIVEEIAERRAKDAARDASSKTATKAPTKPLGELPAGPGTGGRLQIDMNGTFSASERAAAQHLYEQGYDVTLRSPIGARGAGGTSDLLVNGGMCTRQRRTTSMPS